MALKVYEESNISAIADKIREKTSGTAKYTTEEMPDGVAEVYEAGKKAEYDAFWDEYQTNGTRSKYEFAFASYGWTDKTFNPKYDIICGIGYTATSMFNNSLITDVQGILEKKGLILDTSKTYLNSFAQYSHSKRWGVIDATYCANSSSAFGYAFASAHCETIDKLIMNENVATTNGFNNADKLTNITIEGTIGKNFDIHWSPLSYDSIVSIISHLSDTATGQTLTLSKAAVDKAFATGQATYRFNDDDTELLKFLDAEYVNLFSFPFYSNNILYDFIEANTSNVMVYGTDSYEYIDSAYEGGWTDEAYKTITVEDSSNIPLNFAKYLIKMAKRTSSVSTLNNGSESPEWLAWVATKQNWTISLV